MSVSLLEMGCNWRSVASLAKRSSVMPSLDVLQARGVAICERPTSVLVDFCDDRKDIVEVRDWVSEQVHHPFKMFNRFSYCLKDYRTERKYIGVNFRFRDENDAFFFKLTWG